MCQSVAPLMFLWTWSIQMIRKMPKTVTQKMTILPIYFLFILGFIAEIGLDNQIPWKKSRATIMLVTQRKSRDNLKPTYYYNNQASDFHLKGKITGEFV